MKIKKTTKFLKFILGEHIIGITLAPFGIYIREDYLDDDITINHEKIHWKQQMEMLIIFFYVWYGIEWFWKTGLYGKLAYYALSFEREAYQNDQNLNYIPTRKWYSWIKYITDGE
jgi:hypothetical protein